MKGLLVALWVIITGVMIVSSPYVVRAVCVKNCVLAEQVDRIVSNPRGNVENELEALAIRNGGNLFTEAEVSHLVDVGILVRSLRITWIVISICVVFLGKRIASQNIIAGLRVSLGLIGSLGLLILFYWDKFFEGFHRVLFPQGNWAFPADSKLLAVFPENFWQKMGSVTLMIIMIIWIILVLAMLLCKKIKAMACTK